MGHGIHELCSIIWKTHVGSSFDVVPRYLTALCRHPVRTLSFSFDAQYIAYASEDHFIDIVSSLIHEAVCQIDTLIVH